jgi:hypothetical protein
MNRSRRFFHRLAECPICIGSGEEEYDLEAWLNLSGTGALPVMDEVKQEARRRNIELHILPTAQALKLLKAAREDTNAILH